MSELFKDCRDCKWHDDGFISPLLAFDHCKNPRGEWFGSNGKKYSLCEIERFRGGNCGYEGCFFEPRPKSKLAMLFEN